MGVAPRSRFDVRRFAGCYEDIAARLFVSLPETTTLAEKQTPLLDGAPTFVDLDILEERL
jgi:hypothetical protein